MPFESFKASYEPPLRIHNILPCKNLMSKYSRIRAGLWKIWQWNAHADTFCILFDCLNIKLDCIQVLLIVASETGHVYSYSNEKFEPVLNTQSGRKMIKSCLENLSISKSKDDCEKDARVTTINEKYCQTDIGLSGFELYMD